MNTRLWLLANYSRSRNILCFESCWAKRSALLGAENLWDLWKEVWDRIFTAGGHRCATHSDAIEDGGRIALRVGIPVLLAASLSKEQEEIWGIFNKLEERPSIDRARSDVLEDEVTGLTGQVIRFEASLCMSR